MSAWDMIQRSRQFRDDPRQYFGRKPDERGTLPVSEFTKQYSPGEDETWDRAAQRIRGTPRYRALIDNPERMNNPITVHNTWVANGHHRVVRAMDTGQKLRFEHWRDPA